MFSNSPSVMHFWTAIIFEMTGAFGLIVGVGRGVFFGVGLGVGLGVGVGASVGSMVTTGVGLGTNEGGPSVGSCVASATCVPHSDTGRLAVASWRRRAAAGAQPPA